MRKKQELSKKKFDSLAKDSAEAMAKCNKLELENVEPKKVDKARIEKDKIAVDTELARKDMELCTVNLNQIQKEFYHGHTLTTFNSLEDLDSKHVRDRGSTLSPLYQTHCNTLPWEL